MKTIALAIVIGMGAFWWGVFVAYRGGSLLEAFVGGVFLAFAAIGGWVTFKL